MEFSMKRAIFALFCLALSAQDIKMPPGLDKLEAKASEVVNVQLDGPLLQLASGFLSKDDPEEARVKKLVSKLKGVYVSSKLSQVALVVGASLTFIRLR
jgi:hypothetical protein